MEANTKLESEKNKENLFISLSLSLSRSFSARQKYHVLYFSKENIYLLKKKK